MEVNASITCLIMLGSIGKTNVILHQNLQHLSDGDLQVGCFVVELTTDIYVRCNKNYIFMSRA